MELLFKVQRKKSRPQRAGLWSETPIGHVRFLERFKNGILDTHFSSGSDSVILRQLVSLTIFAPAEPGPTSTLVGGRIGQPSKLASLLHLSLHLGNSISNFSTSRIGLILILTSAAPTI